MKENERNTTMLLTFRCGYCNAKPGEWCHTSSGRLSSYLHGSRYWQAVDQKMFDWQQEEVES